uniref:Snake-10 n=1 Tax=Nilaparvata lugens TaxID=108931 RepID=A0A068F5A5_NILLU|nr:snake-10 [Nilaparvata lugens]
MNFKCEGVYLFVIHFGLVLGASLFEEGKPCSTDYGFCVKLKDCYYKFNASNPFPSCGFDKDDNPLICCTTNKELMFGRPGVKLADEMCTRYRGMTCPIPPNYYASIGGTPAKPLELPFMALIGYGPHDDIQWRCGGSLISERFVLSAAHCTQTHDIGPARWVKLGELDTSTEEDDAQPEVIAISDRYDHPDYNPQQVYNDITLYKLIRNVVFNKYIKPICLQTKEFVERPPNALAAGWGRLGFVGKISTKLMKVIVDLYDIEKCSKTSDSNQMPNGIDGNSMMCAGADEGERDTCPGDSGGPLFQFVDETYAQHPCYQHIQYGITSFGNQCGLAEFPGVYTRVPHYLKWIESIAWAKTVQQPNLIWS